MHVRYRAHIARFQPQRGQRAVKHHLIVFLMHHLSC